MIQSSPCRDIQGSVSGCPYMEIQVTDTICSYMVIPRYVLNIDGNKIYSIWAIGYMGIAHIRPSFNYLPTTNLHPSSFNVLD